MFYENYKRIMMLAPFFLLLFTACSTGDSLEEPIETEIIPKNLRFSVNVVGSNTAQPNGDGSGVIKCTVSATNAVRYGFKFGSGEEQESINGVIEHTFMEEGTNNYVISIFAYSNTGQVISTFKTITVYVSEFNEVDEGSKAVWADEFNVDGPVSASNWFSEVVPPNNGSWYNGEQQHYTGRIDNAYVSNGTLKIVAKKESFTAYNSTKNFTSARLNSEFSFTYGRVEVRAKLPEGGGTWPAIWTLGSNINSVGWPSCGEIDIMEHVGNNVGRVSSAIHTPSSSGNTQNVDFINIPDATTEFHVYVMEWTEEKIDFYVDDTLFYTYNPTPKNNETWPFNANQFILLNVAMGGSLGGNIASDFTEASMEIDYVRVYQ